MKYVQNIFLVGYMLIVALFFMCGVGLIVLAAVETWNALQPGTDLKVRERFELILECVGLLTIAVASMDWARPCWKKKRSVWSTSAPHPYAPIPVALPGRGRGVTVDRMPDRRLPVHARPSGVPAARGRHRPGGCRDPGNWGLFVRTNVDAEKLEPHSMHEVQAEDKQIQT